MRVLSSHDKVDQPNETTITCYHSIRTRHSPPHSPPYLYAIALSCLNDYRLEVGGGGERGQFGQPVQLDRLVHLGHLLGHSGDGDSVGNGSITSIHVHTYTHVIMLHMRKS